MFFTLMFLGIFILGFVTHGLYNFLYHKYWMTDWVEWIDTTSHFIKFIGVIGLLLSISMILDCNAGVDNQIAKNQIEYEILYEKYKLIQSDYEDISKVKVLEEIGKWNTKVQDGKYWSENLWTNWFYNKQVVDALQYIDISEIN